MDSLRTLISVAELAALAEQAPLIVDCRFRLADPSAGERAFAHSHIPGAVYAHLDHDLSGPGKGLGRHPLPSAPAFAASLARWGWQAGMSVVAYDDVGGAMAARLWWLLRLAGHASVAVLDGGWPAWQAAGQPLAHGTSATQPTPPAKLAFDATQVVYCEELARSLTAATSLLIDARAAPRFRGESEPIDALAGHVPGAHNRPFADNLRSDGGFKPAAQLRDEWRQVIDDHAPDVVIHMCGSGVTACHNALAMEHAGLRGSRLFAPSWSGWISDPTRPVARGEAA